MISLLTFAEGAYKYASPVVQEYIQSTVFTPLGFDVLCTSLFALPPCTTNVRFVGAGTETLAAQASSAVERLGEYHYIHAQTLHAWGMPYCISIIPLTEGINTTKEKEEKEREGGVFMDNGNKDLSVVVVVDTGCAEAVLRGSDVFAPGVVSVNGVCAVGQRVHIAVDLSHTKIESQKGRESPIVIVDNNNNNNSDNNNNNKEGRDGVMLVCVGYGTAVMDRRTMLCKQHKGLAVRNEWTPMTQPSKRLLSELLHAVADDATQTITRGIISSIEKEEKEKKEECDDDSGIFFLQNYSSMVAVELLMRQLRAYVISNDKPLALLDACAAPGGKTSLLLSLLYETITPKHYYPLSGNSKESVESPSLPFTVVCCERSPLRYRRLNELLQRHFGPSFVEAVVRPFCGDVNKLQQMQRKRETVGESSECFFHGILLDPPCTGMGLRPKLTPHTITLQGIRDSADYQRKLIDSCVKMLCRTNTSVLVYSTCSITLDENESNVLWTLQKYPFIRLARARSEYDRELCSLSATNFGEGRRFLLQDEIREAQHRNELLCLENNVCTESDVCEEEPLMVLRFMPRLSTADEDGVGFFVAVFLCHGDYRIS
ncbi:putative nucleolar protein [Trypanosoma theileri]|uniref:Putative nucleolar protein n=1 Tax=Trypanosoma theileri TaxID=67003 RepID=A0A1X0NZU0_9TRYP|nr:putative nucleolar protein [Trypanosoma theileri]ORC89670.1 putative nucleolar protein [Trypanosoma theileri]